MYLQDFQKIGGIFIPDKVLTRSRKKVRLRGILQLQEQKYYIHVCARSNKFSRITRVCGNTLEDAHVSQQNLLKVYSDAVSENLYGLGDVVKLRQAHFFQWLFCILCNIVSLCMALYLVCNRSGNLNNVLFLLCNIGAIIFCAVFQESLICGKMSKRGW